MTIINSGMLCPLFLLGGGKKGPILQPDTYCSPYIGRVYVCIYIYTALSVDMDDLFGDNSIEITDTEDEHRIINK